jgi:hypothetical protein
LAGNNDQPEIVGGALVTPEGAIPLTPDQIKALEQAAEQAKEEQRQKMQAVVRMLQGKCDTVVKAKASVEKRWVDDERQLEGYPRLVMTSKQYPTDLNSATQYLCPPTLKVTRARTDLWEARLADMLFPANDQAWDLDVPQNFEPGTGDPAKDDMVRAAAEHSCSQMKDVINSQLRDCKFVKAGRNMVRDACRKGMGLLMGPMTGLKKKRFFSQETGQMSVVMVETPTPEIREGNPWFFYPDMVSSVEKAEYAFYLHLLSERELRELADCPGFDREEIAKLLEQDPDLGAVGDNIRYRNENMPNKEDTSDRYGVWRYTGSISSKELKTLQAQFGFDCECAEDILAQTPFMDIWFCQGCVLKAKPLPLDKDYRIPYFVFSPFPADDSMFGYSLPYMCRDSDRVVQAALQMYLHNQSMSSGALMLYRAGSVTPLDGKFEFRGPKVMAVNGTPEDMPMDEAMKAILIPNNAQEARDVLELAIRFIDLEINAEQWATPDPNTDTTQTASGLAMLMNAKSILQRRAAACADDEIFIPIIERMVWWNMLYNEREDIRGDYEAVATTQTIHLVKDIQAQHIQVFWGIAKDPAFQGATKPYGVLKAFSMLLDIPREELLYSEQEYTQNQQNQPPDPNLDLIAAKAKQASATADNQEAQAQLAQAKISHGDTAHNTQAISRQLDHNEFLMEQQTRQAEAQARLQGAQLQAEARMQEIMAKTGMSREQIAAAIHETNTKANTELTKAGMDARTTAAELAVKQQTGSGI